MVARITVHMLNSKMVRSAREALDSFGRSVLAFYENGTVAWGSPKALQTLQNAEAKAPSEPNVLKPIAGWLQLSMSLPVSQAPIFERFGIRLTYIGRSTSNELLVRMAVQAKESAQEQLAHELSLTRREGEVLFWLSQGKTNRDIAEILALSARTVNKHLEQIFQKLGVDNRTSAAVLADRTLSISR